MRVIVFEINEDFRFFWNREWQLINSRSSFLCSKQIGDDVCDFENGVCHYTQDTDDDFDWTQRYGDTPSGNTGPEVDHTTSRMGM